MIPEQTEVFLAWLERQLAENNLTEFQLARRAGITHTVFSKARKGNLPAWDACLAIARALRVPEYEVFRVAGLLPTPPNTDADRDTLHWEVDQLPQYKVKSAIRVVRALSIEDEPSGDIN
jgi:transcriptional regulator with XRE-family HTH domain